MTRFKNCKSLIFLLSLLSFCLSTHAQTNKFDVGIEGGPSLILLYGNDILKNHKPTLGASSGLFFQFNFKKCISLRTNLAFERKGSVLSSQLNDMNGDPIGEVTTNTNFDYLTLPILVRATFGQKAHLFVNMGPYFGYLIKQSSVSEGDYILPVSSDNTSYYSRFDAGLTAGIGFSIPIRKQFLFSFEVRNNLGLYNVSNLEVINDGTIKTNSTNFLLGLSYKLGQRATESQKVCRARHFLY